MDENINCSEMNLQERRIYAAECSAGTSHSTIKSFILRLINSRHFKGRILDYGAGKGDLLELISKQGLFESLSGVDIMKRPAKLGEHIIWHQQDLNESLQIKNELTNLVICSEVIEHLENPRATFRELHRILARKGHLLLTMPNQESIRSISALLLGGHFSHFLGNSYPAHITALLKLDLERLCEETGFLPPQFYYTNSGLIPRLTRISWQRISFGLLRGRLFSDNIGMIAQKK